MLQRFVIIAAWVSVAVLAYVSLTRVGFAYSIYFKLSPFLMHINMRTYGHIVHAVAFAIFGALFAFAYPKRVVFVWCIVLISAITLEYLQTLTPDRHGTLIDALEKIVGGAFGICAARAALYFWPRSRCP
jgi:VanZ family protein